MIFLIGLFVSGVFQFAVWLRFDNPELPIMMAYETGVIFNEKSFLPIFMFTIFFYWLVYCGLLAIGIGLLWVIPYNYVALASFYQTALEEKV